MSNPKGPEFQGQVVCSCFCSSRTWPSLAGWDVSALDSLVSLLGQKIKCHVTVVHQMQDKAVRNAKEEWSAKKCTDFVLSSFNAATLTCCTWPPRLPLE